MSSFLSLQVLIDFLGADPDRPIVLGRVFTTTTPPPYELPKFKMVSGLRSESYPKPKKSGAARMGGGPLAEPSSTSSAAPALACANDTSAPSSSPAGVPDAPLGGGPTPIGLGGVGDSKGLMESELRQRHIKWLVNSKVADVRDGQ